MDEGGTVRPSPDAELIVLPEDVSGAGSVLLAEVQRDDGSAVGLGEAAVDLHAGGMDDPLIEQVSQGQLLFVQSLDALRQEPLHPCPEACETGNVQSPRFQRRGHLRRVDLIEAMDAAATHHKGTDGEAGPNVQSACALWAEQCLVSGEAEDIRPQCLHVDGPRACGLGRVHNKRKAVLFRESRNERKVGQVSGHVRGVGHGHKAGVWAEKPFELVVAQPPDVVHLHEADLCPLLPQAVEGAQHRVVLTDRRDDVVAGADKTGERRVQRLRHVGRKGDAVGAFGMEKCCKSLPGAVDDAGCVKGRLMGTTARVSPMGQCIQHSLPHAGRLLKGSGGVIKVDHGLTTFPAVSIFSAMTYIFVTPPTASCSVRP